MIEAIRFDLGDTLVAEETVIHNSYGQAITAKVIKGVFEVLETMRKDGCRTAMIANANSADAGNIIATCGLENYFDVAVISEEVGIEKPDKQVFQVASDKLGVEAENGVMVGNRSSKSAPDCAALKPEVQKRLRSKGDKSRLGAS